MRCSNVPSFLFHSSTTSCPTIRCSTVQPSDIVLFHHHMFYCSIMTVPLLHYQMFTISPWLFNCSTISVQLFHHQMFHCSIMIVSPFQYQMFYCSTFRCSDAPLSDVLLFHHQIFYCSTTKFSTVPPSLFHYQMFHCSTMSVELFHRQMVHCSTIFVLLFHYICSTVLPW